jgi:hypothetical protein
MTDDIEEFCSLWDQAQKSGAEFKTKKPAKAIEPKRDIPNFNEDEFEHDDPYFNYIANEPEDLLQEVSEEEIVGNKKKKKLSGNPNRKSTLGKDSNPKIWVDEEALAEVEKLKRKLYEIECKLNAEDAGGTEWQEKAVEPKDKALWSQIEKLKGQVDDLSDTLGLNYEPAISLYDDSK